MVQQSPRDKGLSALGPPRFFHQTEAPLTYFLRLAIFVDWYCLFFESPSVLETIGAMQESLNILEVPTLFSENKHSTYGLIMILIWSYRALIPIAFSLTTSNFIRDGYDSGVITTAPKHRCGRRPSNMELCGSPKYYKPILRKAIQDWIHRCLYTERFRKRDECYRYSAIGAFGILMHWLNESVGHGLQSAQHYLSEVLQYICHQMVGRWNTGVLRGSKFMERTKSYINVFISEGLYSWMEKTSIERRVVTERGIKKTKTK
jgi:hypothetical protein